MVRNSVSHKCALERGGAPTEEILSVHQSGVHLVFDKRHQNARADEPADSLQNKQDASLNSQLVLS